MDSYFLSQLPYMLHHILVGEIKKGKSFGIHFFQKEIHQIQEMISEPNKNGIWEAKIGVLNHKTLAFRKKEKSSTFFPTSWNEEILIKKLEEAFDNKKKIKPFKHIGITSCGIKIAFLFQQGIITSCFPLYD